MPTIRVLLPLAAVYPDTPRSVKSFQAVLKDLSRTDTLFYIARLNTIVSKPALFAPADGQRRVDEQRRALAFLALGQETRSKIDDFAKAHGGTGKVIVICRGQLLELLRWVTLFCKDHADDGVTFEDENKREKLFQAILLASEIWSRRVYANINAAASNNLQSEAHKLALIRRSQTENDLTLPGPVAFGRGWELFHSQMCTALPEFDTWFTNTTGLTLKQHYAVTVLLNAKFQEAVRSMPDGEPDNIGVFDIRTVSQETQIQEQVDQYLKITARSVNELATAVWPSGQPKSDPFNAPPDYPFLGLRTHPLLRSTDDRCIILDPIFFRDLALSGVLFKLPTAQRQVALEKFGKAFEGYCQAILSRMFPTVPGLVQQLFTNIDIVERGNRVGELDACLVQTSGTLVFESKAAWLRDDMLNQGAELAFLAHLDERYADEKKGTGQLASVLRHLSKLPRAEWPECLRDTQIFFPVIISYSHMGYSFAEHLLSQFESQLGVRGGRWHPYPELIGVSAFKVAPLCVLSISELEILEEVAKNAELGRVFVEYALSDVSKRGTIDEFLSKHQDYRDLKRHNQFLCSIAEEAFAMSGKMAFGNKVLEE